MNLIEKWARELLLAQYLSAGYKDGDPLAASDANAVAIKAIIAALTPPDGYVLVPVEPTDDMIWAPSDVEVGYPTWAGSRDGCTTDEAKAIWASMLAARPVVPQ